MDRFTIQLGEFVIRFRWYIVISTIILASLAASGGRFLTFTNDSRIYFSKENPQLQALEALEGTYNKEDNLLFILAPKDGNVFTRETLAAIEQLTRDSWQIPFSSRVDSLSNYQHTYAEEDDLIVEDLATESVNLSDQDIDRIKHIALAEPLLVNRIISPTGHVTAVNILVIKPGKSIDETVQVAKYGRQMADDFREQFPEIDIHLTGGIMIDNAFGEASQNDITTLVPAMYITLLLIMAISLRSVSGTFATLLVIVFAMMTAVGITGWLGKSLNPSTVNAPTIILTLAVADSIHILISLFHSMREGKNKQEAICESLRINMQPVLITSVTTAVGFLSMNFSDAPPFRELGNLVAIGIIAAFILSTTFLPALMAILPVRRKQEGSEAALSKPCDWLAELVVKRKDQIFWGFLTLGVVVTAGMFRIELDDDFIRYFDERYDFRQATDFAEKHITGFNVIEYSLESGESGGINEPRYLETIESFANWYRSQPNVSHVYTVTDIMKRLNKNMHQDDPAYYKIPQGRELAAQYLLLYEMSLPFGLDTNNIINVDKSSTRFVVRLTDVTSKELRQMDDKAREWLKANAPENMFTYGTGLSMMFAHISERNIKSMLGASFGALILISAILILALRNFRIGLASLIPNLAPALMAFGFWGIFVGQVGLVVSILAALTLGIVVDDTVHFLSKYLWARRHYKMEPEDAVRYAFHTVGTALWVTTIVLVAGFLVLSLSGFSLNSDMGLMTALTIFIALVMDFLFLPTLVMKIDRGTI